MKMLAALLLVLTAGCSLRQGLITPQGITVRKGMALGNAVRRLRLDSTQYSLTYEPPGVIRGVEAQLPDSSELWLRIERFGDLLYSKRDAKRALKRKITGIAIARPNCSTSITGKGFVHFDRIEHPNCRKRR